MDSPAPTDAPLTLEQVSRRVRELCRADGLCEPDVVLDTHDGEFVALWFAERLAVIVETGPEAKAWPDDDRAEAPDGPA